MPELPDITVYIDALEARIRDTTLRSIRMASPFLLRTVEPPLKTAYGRRVRAVRRLGKRIVIELEREHYLVLHLMIAGRLRWLERDKPIPKKLGLAAFDFDTGTLLLTEAGTKRRASLHFIRGPKKLAELDRGGLEVMDADVAAFRAALTRENHTLKRTLTDPRLFSGIGNAYSDEILHAAELSPLKLSQSLDEDESERLFRSTQRVLTDWIERLRAAAGGEFPMKVTAFRPGMSVHGRFGEPCPVCGSPVQRIVYAENECNYCARCQTGGKVLADRALSRLLKDDWPRTIDELEERKRS